mgnify:CR=1 FL=1
MIRPWNNVLVPSLANWVESLDLGKIADEDRYKILEDVVGKYGRVRAQEDLGVSRTTMWRLLSE